MSSGVTATCDSTVTVLLLSHVLPRFFLLFLFSFLKITTCIASYFFSHRKTFVSYLQTIGFMGWNCSVLNKLTLLKLEIHMEESKKKYTPYTESERMSYIREYLSTSETKYQFAKRTGICRRLLILWLDKYHINDKVMSTEQPSLRKDSDESLNELEKELAELRAENRKLQRALQEERLRHEACEELINLAESTYHIKVRKNSDAK